MAAVMRLVERQSAWPVLARRELVGQHGEGARDLIAGSALLARDLDVVAPSATRSANHA
jgi:hypothetical protein